MNRLLLFVSTATLLHAADAVPSWVTEASRQPVPAYPAWVSSVALLREESVAVAADGTRVMTERGVIRVLRASRNQLSAWRTYNEKSGRIRQFDGWMMSPDGKVTSMKKDRVADRAVAQGSMYSETRLKELECGAGAAAGSLFAYEIVEEERTVFTHYHYAFQDRFPALLSRFSIALPAGWEAKGRVMNHASAEPAAASGRWTWELRNLPPIEEEDYGPELHALQPALWVAYFPAGDNKAGLRPLPTWKAVSAWLSELTDDAATPGEPVRAKAAELTVEAKSELDKIRAIAAFVQKTVYVSVQLNLTRGGGYVPNPADKVLGRNYGDCKDKAALTRALLKAAGIDSYMVAIYSGDRTFVNPEWPSPMQFNHAIVAVRVSAATRLDTVIEHPELGSLLIFDPTSEWTPLGDLPEEQQGSYALLVAGPRGDLVRMPLRAAAVNRVQTSVTAAIGPRGEVAATLSRRYHGQAAKSMRSLHNSSADALRKVFETAITRRVGASSIDRVSGTDSAGAEQFEATVQFSAPQFGQSMKDRLLVFRPGALAVSNDYGFPAKERTTPIRLRARVRADEVEVKVPGGYSVDELPDPVQLESAYGRYKAIWTSSGEVVRLEQTIEVRDTVAPATEYGAIREFFGNVHAAQQSAVVLAR